MKKSLALKEKPRCYGHYWGLALVIVIIIIPLSASAANLVNVRVSGMINDTISPDYPAAFDFWIENDIVLGGINLGFKVWSPDGAWWEWQRPCIIGMNSSFVCIVPGSRADSPCLFDPFQFDPTDLDGISPDTFQFGWQALDCGLETGPLEHMFSAHFMADLPGGPGEVASLCIDSTFIPPNGDFIFIDLLGSTTPPTIAWPNGGICLPVAWAVPCMASWNPNNPTSMTIEHCDAGQVTLGASQMDMQDIEFHLESVDGGSGTADITPDGYNCIVTYTPVPEDIGQSITIEVSVGCRNAPVWDWWFLDVTVTNDSPVLDIGSYYNWGATNNLLTKADIAVTDNDACEDPGFFIISGPGEINPSTGVYTYMPGPGDSGVFYATVAVTDGVDTSQAEIYLGITGEDCCPGDVNYTGDVNVGDAVSLINYIFKEGTPPKVMNWADPNADCQVNVGDVVFLIAYIFRGGPAPVIGCYY